MLLLRTDHSRCVRMLARRVSFFASRRTLASSERYGHLVLLSSVSAWPFQQGACHRCVGVHTLLRISRLKLLKHVFLHLCRPQIRTPKCTFDTTPSLTAVFCIYFGSTTGVLQVTLQHYHQIGKQLHITGRIVLSHTSSEGDVGLVLLHGEDDQRVGLKAMASGLTLQERVSGLQSLCAEISATLDLSHRRVRLDPQVCVCVCVARELQ